MKCFKSNNQAATTDTFASVAKKSKKKNRLQTVSLSVLAALLVLGIGTKVLSEVTSHYGCQIRDDYDMMHTIASPNVDYTSAHFQATSHFSGEFHSEQVKDLNGVPVAYAAYNEKYHLFGRTFNLNMGSPDYRGDQAYARATQMKIAQFYNVNLVVDKNDDKQWTFQIAQELPLVAQMDKQLVEVALTFDKNYSYADIQSMIPDNLKINWYWIGSQSSQFDTAFAMPFTLFGTSKLPDQADEYANSFMDAMKQYIQSGRHVVGTRDYWTTDDVQDYIDRFGQIDLTKNIEDRNRFEFAGVILTGKAENFAQLEGADWIYASSIGASTQLQPYHQLDVE